MKHGGGPKNFSSYPYQSDQVNKIAKFTKP